jgi:hypothetical protein
MNDALLDVERGGLVRGWRRRGSLAVRIEGHGSPLPPLV